MKLLIVAALVSVSAAARLDHLERGYLPPDHNHGQAGFGSQGFNSQLPNSFGSGSSFGSYDTNGIDSSTGQSQGFASSVYPGATSNQYLPPDHAPTGSNGQFRGSLTGFQRSQSFGSSQYTPNQYGSVSNGFAQPRYQQQYPSGGSQYANRQYLAPKSSSFQNLPQQPFDEKTGYIY